MTVKELLEKLKHADPDALVVLQKDAEGNGYSPLEGADEAHYKAETSWAGEVYVTPEGETVPCVILYPVN
jgi:hypothetical protein